MVVGVFFLFRKLVAYTLEKEIGHLRIGESKAELEKRCGAEFFAVDYFQTSKRMIEREMAIMLSETCLYFIPDRDGAIYRIEYASMQQNEGWTMKHSTPYRIEVGGKWFNFGFGSEVNEMISSRCCFPKEE